MTFSINRRGFMAGGASLLSLSALGAPAFAEDARLRLIWWGSQPRADRTNKVSDLYKSKNPGVSITGEFLGWGDYWPRLATQVAGKNAPDVIQMDYRYIVEYAGRGALAPLESYMPAKLNLGDFDKAQVEGGSVNGHLYGVSLGAQGRAWKGRAVIQWKRKWPTWTPTPSMIGRNPKLSEWKEGMPPGLSNPLGARALYIFQDGQDTLYRIHGSPEWRSIGKNASSGCVRMFNQDIIDLYDRVRGKAILVVK